MKTLCFLQQGSLSTYIKDGFEKLSEYYNPLGWFDKVYSLSQFDTENYQVEGIEVIPVHTLDEYKSIISKLKPDVIRAYGAFGTSDWACYNKNNEIPVIVSVHDTRFIRQSVCLADIVVCMSDIVKRKVMQFGIEEERIRILPNRVDTHMFQNLMTSPECNKIRNMFPQGRMVLCIGRKTYQKNTDNIVKALKHLPREYFCVFVGVGSRDYLNFAFEQGLTDRCFWLESVKNSELPFWYNAADCFCLPSRWEGFGIVFAEAASCECPIITSNIAPMNEFLNSNNAILIDDYENPAAIAQAVLKGCSGTDEIITMCKNARMDIVYRFEKAKVDRLEISIYEEIVGNREQFYITRTVGKADTDLENTSIAVWGAGERGKRVYAKLRDKGYKVVCFIDNDPIKRGVQYLGIPVVSPAKLSCKMTIVVPDVYYQEVFEQCQNGNIENEIQSYNWFSCRNFGRMEEL